MSRPSGINLPAHAGDCTHEWFVGLPAVYHILHVRVNMSRKVMVEECARICVFHDQILLSFADRITIVQHLSTSIAHAVRKHRLKLTMNLPEIL